MIDEVATEFRIASPLGTLTARFSEVGLVALGFPGEDAPSATGASDERVVALSRQLDEYFAGERRGFEVALDLRGTSFQRAVWRALVEVPWGETVSYSTLAERLGRPRAIRAVGAANARNPIAIIVPCHRVIGADGALRGYAWGLDRKRALLDLEQVGEGVRSRPLA